MPTAHLINHTHWDREWFLTSAYTSRWLPGLLDRLQQLVSANPAFHFWLDGQTLVVEDLLQVAPEYAGRLRALAAGGNLMFGPYYCQPDWQLTGGELLIRNLAYGLQDMQAQGADISNPPPGWLVDTFGHIRQAPQIHRLFGIEAVYVWRGVPELVPYFWWQAPDGSRLLTINLFGGYRNLYGVSHAPRVAVRRLQREVGKLLPYYPTGDIPLFDGYDLEDDPEDPFLFFQTLSDDIPGTGLAESDPARFARLVWETAGTRDGLPTLDGELNSGKYGAVFPGKLSSRADLKVMAADCEHLLFQVCEPLGVLAHLNGRPYDEARYAAWGRVLLQNAIHDAICGVSIDLVHEKMEHRFRQVFEAGLAGARGSLSAALAGFAPGVYAVSTSPFAASAWVPCAGRLYHARTVGVGIFRAGKWLPVERMSRPVDSFLWRSPAGEMQVGPDGIVRLAGGRGQPLALGRLDVYQELGDTYSDARGERLGALTPLTPLTLLERSPQHSVVGFQAGWSAGERRVTAAVRICFDASPLVRWQIELDSRGADLRVELVFETGLAGQPVAGMPFDLVPRPFAVTDLLPPALPDDLASLLLGQREFGQVSTFPFQGLVALAAGAEDQHGQVETAVVLARGLHAYQAGPDGTLRLALLRAVEWLTRPGIPGRAGDAGPFFYVPDARCERTITHAAAFALGRFAPDSPELLRLAASFLNPPLLVRVGAEDANSQAAADSRADWQLLHEELPMSSLVVKNGEITARFYNPTNQALPLSRPYAAADEWGSPRGERTRLEPKEIACLRLPLPDSADPGGETVEPVEWLNPPQWRVGPNAGAPDPAVLAWLEQRIVSLEAQADRAAAEIRAAAPRPAGDLPDGQDSQGVGAGEMDFAGISDPHGLRQMHHYYILKRESVEHQLSLALNRRKLAEPQPPGLEYLYEPDAELAAIGLRLNRLRIKRRIFDYVVQALEGDPTE